MLLTTQEKNLAKRNIVFEEVLFKACKRLYHQFIQNDALSRLDIDSMHENLRSSLRLLSTHSFFPKQEANVLREGSMQTMGLILEILRFLKDTDQSSVFIDVIQQLNPKLEVSALSELMDDKDICVIHYVILSSSECNKIFEAADDPTQKLQNLVHEFKESQQRRGPLDISGALKRYARGIKTEPAPNPYQTFCQIILEAESISRELKP